MPYLNETTHARRASWRDELLAGIVWLHAAWFGMGFFLVFLFPPALIATGVAFVLVGALAWRARYGRALAAAGLVAVAGLEALWAVVFLATEDGRRSSMALATYVYGASMVAALLVAIVVVVRTAFGH